MSRNCRGQTLIKDTLGIRTELPCILDLIILLSNLPGFTKSLCPLVNLLYGIYIGTISTLQWAPIGIIVMIPYYDSYFKSL